MIRLSGIKLVLSVTFLILSLFPAAGVFAQCVGLPAVSSLGSNKFPVGLCAPVNANVTYNVSFTSPVPAGTLELIYDWSDGSPQEVIPLVTGNTQYSAARTHTFPAESDCEYPVVITLRYNGVLCTNTRQLQKIASWRTDNHNGAEIGLVVPGTGLTEHFVCEGDNIGISFKDESKWNCSSQYIETPPNPIETPNTEGRWQQIIYNTGSGSKIPNISIDGIPVTGNGGANVITNYNDPRGIAFMASPVYYEDARRRPSLLISAPGGFGAGFPKAGDSFAITLRYWNFCNPYDDPAIPGPPVDAANGDHPPVVRTSYIRIVAPPTAPVATNQSVCNGTTPSAFTVTGVPTANIVRWYANIPNPDRPGSLIATSRTLAITAHPEWVNNTTAGAMKVWVSHQATTAGATNCESPKTLVVRAIRESLTVPDPVIPLQTDVCNRSPVTVSLPAPVVEPVGGATSYIWTGSSGVTLTSSSASSATFSTNITNFGTALYVDRTITVTRQYTAAPTCAKARVFTIRIYKPAVAGVLAPVADVCENVAVSPITLSGYTGDIARWEVKKDAGNYELYTGGASGASITPGILTAGVYTFRAVVKNGGCNEVYSNEEIVEVFAQPVKASAGQDQFICTSLSSAALDGSNPAPGTGVWSYVSSIPAGLPAPAFSTHANDPHTSISVQAAYAGVYRMRWTVVNGLCSSFDDVIIDFGTNPSDPDAGQDRAVCAQIADLQGNAPAIGSGTWTVVSGPGCSGDACPVTIVTPTSPTSMVELKGPTYTYGNYTFRWSISSGGNNCFLKSDEVTIRFDEPIRVSASNVQDICLDATKLDPIKITGTVEGIFSQASWQLVSGTGTVTASTITGSGIYTVEASYIPTANDYTSGAPIQVKLSAQPNASSSCNSVEQTINIIMDRKPNADAGVNMPFVCNDYVKLNAAAPLYGAVGTWTSTQPGIMFDNPNDPQTTVRNLPAAPGSAVVTWTVTSASGKCISDPSSVTLTRVNPPLINDLNLTECEVSNGTTSVILSNYDNSVTPLAAGQREVTWYKDAAPPTGTLITNPATAQVNVANGQVYIARVRELNTSCTSDARVTVNVRPLPKVMNGLVTLCEETPGSGTVSGINLMGAQYTGSITSEANVNIAWYNSEADAFNNVAPITQPIMVTYAKEVYARVTYRDAPACYTLAKLNIVVNSSPSITTIFGRESVCQGSIMSNVEIYQVTPIPGAKYYWDIPTQFVVFGGGTENDFYVMLQFPNVYTGTIRVRAERSGCSGRVIEKTITVLSAPARPVIRGADVVCEDNTGIAFNVSPNNYPASVYNWEIRRASDNSIGGADIIEGQTTGNILVNFLKEDVILSVRENNAICASPEATKVITVTDAPQATLAVEKDITCFLAKDGAIRTTVASGTTPYTEYKILQTGATDANLDGVFENLGQGSYSVRVKDANGCEATTNTVVLMQPSQVTITGVNVLTDANGFHVSCKDASDGAITVSFSGGSNTADYSATLNRAGDLNVVKLTGSNSLTFTNLLPGTYTIVVEDAKGCASQPAVAFLVNPPVFYGGLIGTNQSICSGADPARIEELAPASGDVGNYTYEWQESATGNLNNDAEWTTIPGATGIAYDPTVLTTIRPEGEQRHYRRLTRSISTLHGTPVSCEVKGKTEKVTITINPIPQVTFRANATEVCYGDPLSLLLDVTVGTAPIEYEYSSVLTGRSPKRQGGKNTIIAIPDFKANDTYTLVSVTDANGCAVGQLPPPVSVNVILVNPVFTVSGSGTQCDGGEFTFGWNVENGVDYRWEWSDGTITEITAGTLPLGAQQITHRFPIGSNQESTVYPVKLFAKHPACIEKYTTQSITVFPAIAINIGEPDASVCSGETVTFRDNSAGVDHGKWFYRELGTTARLDEKPGAQRAVSFTLNNYTSKDPIIYEVVYEAFNNEGCRAEYKKPITVYRGTVVDFSVGPVSIVKGEVSQVTITNTSPSIEPQNFEYIWDFGQHSAVSEGDGITNDVQYFSPGQKNVTLTAVNRMASQAGEYCVSIVSKQINIPVQELKASFIATPTAACYPVSIQVMNSTTGADTFLWKVYNQGALVTTSNLRNPVFKISNPGIYDLYMTASYSATGQSADAEFKGIQVFDVPQASFAVRSGVIYVPDTELDITNFSTGADIYTWLFGDGGTSSDFEPKYTYQQEGTYVVTLLAGRDYGDQDRNGDGISDGVLACYDTAQQEIVAVAGGSIVIPNAFTPSAAGPSGGRPTAGSINDVFMPKVSGITEYTMQIFNRWGTLIFESRDPDIGWDGYDRNGKFMPAGVYVYKIALTQSDGQRITRLGDVTLIR
ncbi:gliding motility-associated C-terminal domain-containing protein [Ohtaekwangia kribbensis]|uniref:Gliding motility-associated C-terminal domain-containing protein n=1 Tax=Ohtaekwangia kribbensis TaxID=688913 RepID=A0ABW3K368_9BACT